MKEYEKLLQQEENRLNNEKAKTLVKLGLFLQETVQTIDFSTMEEITLGKKYKGVYSLYETHEGELVYIRALTETDSPKEAYSYDVIRVESVPDDELQEVYNAGIQEKGGFLKVLRVAQMVFLSLSLLCLLIDFISSLASQGMAAFVSVFVGLVLHFSFVGLQTGLLMVTTLLYKRQLLK